MDIEKLKSLINSLYLKVSQLILKPECYTQVIFILVVTVLSFILTRFLKSAISKQHVSTSQKLKPIIISLYKEIEMYLFPIILITALSLGYRIKFFYTENIWILSIFQAIVGLYLANKIISKTFKDNIKKGFAQIIIVPIILLFFLGWLDDVSSFFESYKIKIGNIKTTFDSILRTIILGVLLFWFCSFINTKGKEVIKKQKNIDARSKGLFSKLYEMLIYIIFFIFMLQITGIDITALLIFGGAIGVGLGLGLQSISSNFISGLMLLLDRSISLGDHIELEDGKQGTVRELNMRSVTLETYEGKDILVPNEKFISNTFINWTHTNAKQRYSITLQVSYKTDLHKLFDIIRTTVSKHPQVYSGDSIPIEERPDAEISSFGDSGVNILIEFWMDGVDDGRNRVGADILLMIWDAFKENNIVIPYPQREVNMISN